LTLFCQVLWDSEYLESPSAWRLFGREASADLWSLVDTMATPRSEPATYKHINRTAQEPGYYAQYKFVFSEYAPIRGDSAQTSNGHVIRDIIFNPNGFALHYGSPPARAASVQRAAGVGHRNLALGQPVALSTTYEDQPYTDSNGRVTNWAVPWRATDGTPAPRARGDLCR